MKIEIGGGMKPRGEGFVNVDRLPSADVQWDLLVMPWPFADASVEHLYSSHCFEHLDDMNDVLFEIARICLVGAEVEIWMPHPRSDMAMCSGHKHVMSPLQARNIEEFHAAEYWKNPRRLKLMEIKYRPAIVLSEARSELPFLAGLSDEVIMKWIGGTCHECGYYWTVVENEFVPSDGGLGVTTHNLETSPVAPRTCQFAPR